MKKLNFKITHTNIVVHYVAIFIATVAGYWLIYWVTMWGLYGIANVSNSASIMDWLADENYFYPARESSLSNYYRSYCDNTPIQSNTNIRAIEEAVGYLKHDVWIKEEMDSIQYLVGLYDELNEYDSIGIYRRNELIESPDLERIIEALCKCDTRKLRKPYNHKGDTQIRPRLYLKVIESGIIIESRFKRQSNSQKQIQEESNFNKIEHKSKIPREDRW